MVIYWNLFDILRLNVLPENEFLCNVIESDLTAINEYFG